ncbi:MAG: ADP-ribosylation factor-like protein, partial [Candidatus Odinarchaeota archaeon]
MRHIVLSTFHPKSGPKISLVIPSFDNDFIQYQICKTLDLLEDPGFFAQQHVDGEQVWDTANLYFEVQAPSARGGVQMALLTLILTEEAINPIRFRFLLMALVDELVKLPRFADYIEGSLEIADEKQLMEECRTIIQEWLNSLPKDVSEVLDEKSTARLFVFGLDQAGKTTIVTYLKEGRFLPTIPTLRTDIVRILASGISFVCIDLAGQKRFRSSWKDWLNDPDILVFVVDSSAHERFEEAREALWSILRETTGIPLLVLNNKKDLEGAHTISEVSKKLNIHEVKDRQVTLLETSGKTGYGLPEAFRTILKTHVDEESISEEKKSLLVIMVRWDEREGPEVIEYYPKTPASNISIDDLAVQAFMTGQAIFGRDRFEKTFISLPFHNYNLRSRLVFDWKPAPSTRGGRDLYLVGIFADTETVTEQTLTVLEHGLRNFIRNEFPKPDPDLLMLYVESLALIEEQSPKLSQTSLIFNQEWLCLYEVISYDKPVRMVWKFGSLADDVFTDFSEFTRELFATGIEGITIIKLESEDQEKEITLFLSSFGERFFLVISNPRITARLLRTATPLESQIEELVQSGLAAQAISTYTGLFTQVQPELQRQIDQIFIDGFTEMNIRQDPSMYVSNGECNFSGLGTPELIFLHWYIRKRFESTLPYQVPLKAIIFDQKTRKTFFQFGYEEFLATSLSEKTADLTNAFEDLLGFLPRKIARQTPNLEIEFQ